MPAEEGSIAQATDVISGILSSAREEAATPEPSAPPAEQTPQQATTETPDVDLGGEEQEKEQEEQVAQEEPATEGEEASAQEEPEKQAQQASQDDATDIELEPAQFAEILGLEESDLTVAEDGAVTLTAKVDGKTEQVSLRDLRDGYQLAKTSQQRLSKLAEDRKALDAERAQAVQVLSQQHQQLSQALQEIEQAYVTDFGAVDWNRLREEDTTEYNLRRNDFEDRRRKVEEFKAKAQHAGMALQHQHLEQVKKLQAEGARQLEETFSGPEYRNAPKWDDQERQRLVRWIQGQGFTAEQINSTTEPRLFQWARDAMLWREQQMQAKKTAKRVVRLPKISRPGKPKSQAQVKRTKLDNARAKQRKAGGDLKSTTELIRNIFEQ